MGAASPARPVVASPDGADGYADAMLASAQSKAIFPKSPPWARILAQAPRPQINAATWYAANRAKRRGDRSVSSHVESLTSP